MKRKKGKKIKFGTEPGWATAQLSLRLGWAGRWARHRAPRLGARHAGTAQAAWAHGRGARWRGACGRRACGRGLGASGRTGAGALGERARAASGHWAGALHGRTTGGHALQASGTGAR